MKQRYDSYKPSGIDWFGEIPSHWESRPLKRVGTMNTGLTFTKADLVDSGEAVVSYGQIHSELNDKVHLTSNLLRFIPKSISKSNISAIAKKGSFIFADTSEDLDGCGNAVYIDTDEKIFAGYHTIIFKRDNDEGKYLAYLFQTDAWRSQIRSQVSGVKVYSITQTILSSTSIILPPLAEQEAIATWLDEKCGEIDAAIAKVDREIELIDELKQSEISRVVTHGLNPDTPLRPSDIDWIGDIPEHWAKSRIKHHVCRSAAGVWGEDEKGNEDDIVCFRIADFNYGERCLSFDKITIRNIDKKQLDGRLLSEGDLLIEKSGGGDATPVGRVVYCNYTGRATYTNFIHSITLNTDVSSRFFLYYFNMLYSNKINLLFFNQTTGLQNLQVRDYLSQSIYLPPFSEQKDIADYLDKKCAEIDGLKAKLVKKRETLKELRHTIISEVVTGKRKVI